MNQSITLWTFAGIVTVLSAWLGLLALPVILLILAMIIDYITGIMASGHREEKITSYKSINGISKKISLLLLVVVALILDVLIHYCITTFDMSLTWNCLVAVVAAVWITVNEIISILENIQDIGVELPPWLLPLAKNIKGKVESIPTTENKED